MKKYFTGVIGLLVVATSFTFAGTLHTSVKACLIGSQICNDGNTGPQCSADITIPSPVSPGEQMHFTGNAQMFNNGIGGVSCTAGGLAGIFPGAAQNYSSIGAISYTAPTTPGRYSASFYAQFTPLGWNPRTCRDPGTN